MKKTIKNISDADIIKLRNEAAQVDDILQCMICDIALNGSIDLDEYTGMEIELQEQTTFRGKKMTWRDKLKLMRRNEAIRICAVAINEFRSLDLALAIEID